MRSFLDIFAGPTDEEMRSGQAAEGGYVPWEQRAEEETRTIRPAFFGQERRGVFGTALDIVNRPLFAAANLAYGDPSAAGRAMIPFGGTIERMTGLPTGLAEEERRTFADVLRASGVGEMGRRDLPVIGEVTGRGAVGLGLDIALDPLTYLGAPIYKYTGKAAGALAKTRVAQRIAKTGLVRWAGKAVIPGFGKAKAFMRRLGLKRADERSLALIGRKASDQLRRTFDDDVLTRAGTLIEEVWGPISRTAEKGARAGLYDEALAVKLASLGDDTLTRAVGEITKWEGALLDYYQAKHMITKGMERGHIAHLWHPKHKKFWASPEGKQFIRGRSIAKEAAGELEKRTYKAGKEFMGQVLEYGSFREINEIAMRKAGHPIFDTDIARIIQQEYRHMSRAVSSYDMLASIRKFVDDPDHPWVKELTWEAGPKGKMRPTNLEDGFAIVEDRWSVLRNVQIGKEEADVLRQAAFRILDPAAGDETARGILRTYDGALSWWKRWTLAPFPAYHSRNFASNAFNCILGGISPAKLPGEFKRGYGVLLGKIDNVVFPRGSHAAIAFKRARVGAEQLMDDMVKRGVIGQGLYGVEVAASGATQMAMDAPKIAANLMDAMRHPLRTWLVTGTKAGRYVEDGARASLYISGLRKGMTPEKAALRVNKFLFDWSATGYAKFEWETLRRIFPFYGWLRHNLPLQVEMLMRRPGVFAQLGKVKRFIEHDKPTPRHLAALPDWIKERVALNVGHDTKTGETRFWYWGNWLPAADLEELLRPQRAVLENLTPFVKVPLEMVINYDTFFRRPLQEYPGERDPYLWPASEVSYLPWYAEHPLRSIRAISTMHRLTRQVPELGVKAGLKAAFVPGRELAGLSQYKIDLRKEAVRQRRALKSRIGQTKRDITRATKRKDPREIERLKQLLKDTKEELQGLAA